MTIVVPDFTSGVVESTKLGLLADAVSFGLNGQITVSLAVGTILGLSTTVTDIPSATVTVTVTGANAFALALGIFDFSNTAAAAVMFGYLNVDGSDQTVLAVKDGAAADRATVAQVWKVALAAGGHTLKLRSSKSAALGTMNANAGSTIAVLLVDNQ